MKNRDGAGPRRLAVVLTVAASLMLMACGDDDEESASGGGSAGSSAAQTITITATGTEKAPEFEVSGTAKAGAATIEIQNDLAKGTIDGQLVHLAEEHSDEEVVAELGKAIKGKPVADWFQGGGGPGETEAGETSSVTQELEAGTYVVAAGENKPRLPLAKIEVEGDGGPEFEPPAAKVSATEYAFSGEGVTSGEPVLLENAGGEWHHFLASRLKPGATIADAKKFLMTEKGEPPFAGEGEEDGIDPENGIGSTVLDGGVSQTVDFTGKPGKYAFFCFIADKKGGPPHVVKGMVSEVVVE